MKPEVFTDSPLSCVIIASSSFQASQVCTDSVLSVKGFCCLWNEVMLHTHQHYCLRVKVMDRYPFPFVDLRQELAVRESRPEVTRMSAPSSPTPDNDKTDSAVQASLSLPATPLSKNLDNAFTSQTGRRLDFFLRCIQCHTCLLDSLGSCLLQLWPTAPLMQPSLHLLEYRRSILLAISCAKLG